ncbi:MAG: DUF5682 family protein [Planctomycetes bacterium]|nr:DUF5682 family protein [Planctomycetota bacterium]
MNDHEPAEFVAALPSKMRTSRVTYFPIRHHSPACAAHLRRWIATNKPAAVLIEGPSSFTAKIDLLLDAEAVCPFALYTTFADKKARLGVSGPLGPRRFAAYYPFCDYSPELVALRAGRAAKANLRFIDLEYAEMVLHRQRTPDAKPEGVRVDSLAADGHLSHSEYIRELARRLGCRDFNEAWDHLFETQWDSDDTDGFIDRVATYCAMARFSYRPEQLEADGTNAREACMAAAILDELKQLAAAKKKGPVLVVTGGFHSVVLPNLVGAGVTRPEAVDLAEDEGGSWLMRYSFDQLDALAGYASGMPQPAFYDRLWHASETAPDPTRMSDVRTHAAADIAVEVSRLTRLRGFHPAVTTPDATAAVRMSRELAAFRGHPWPTRDDVLDGMRSCFVKGETVTDGVPLLRLVAEVLAGNRVGSVPKAAGVPPIVDDFYREARRLKLPVDVAERKELALDLYRDVRHRGISRLLHRLALLGSPYGEYHGGPDFAAGTGLELMQEHWQVRWSPGAESSLVEAVVYGPTVEEAAGSKLLEEVAGLETGGFGRNTAKAVEVLVKACRLGLHKHATALTDLVSKCAAEDPSFVSLVSGLTQLELLGRSREPLEATHLTTLPNIALTAYQRACYLAADLVNCPNELVDPGVRALQSLRESLGAESRFDADLLHNALRTIITSPPDKGQTAVIGAAAGILYGEGKLAEADLVVLAMGFLGGTSPEPRHSAGFVRGLLATAREVAWQVAGLVQALDARFGGWDDESFLGVLPELRLAFADLTPREIARVADAVAGMHDTELTGLVRYDLSEKDALLAVEVTRLVRESLAADGLTTA